jgi:hypothetical protein
MATGIINSALNTASTAANPVDPMATTMAAPTASSTNASIATPAGGTPTATAAQIDNTAQWKSTPDQTVAGQVANITDANGPLQQQAKTTALQGMNERGLLNSSMAQTAGQSAAYAAALPIAQTDAAQASKVAGYNTDVTNQANTANVAAKNAANTTSLQTGAAQNVADIEAQYKDLTQGSASATSIMNKMQDSLNALGANKDITDATKRTAMEQDIRKNAQDSLNMIGAFAGDTDLHSAISGILA